MELTWEGISANSVQKMGIFKYLEFSVVNLPRSHPPIQPLASAVFHPIINSSTIPTSPKSGLIKQIVAVTTDTADTDCVVLATLDLQKVNHRFNSTMYGDRDDELVKALSTCLKGKVSNTKIQTTISTLISILNDCVDEITTQRKSVTRELCWT